MHAVDVSPCQAIVGQSRWASRIRGKITRAAASVATVLITGPTGTGKELIARAVHAQSCRAGKPFVAVDCAAIAGTLFASEMFGHRKGAFTGAAHESAGCFRAADGGTIFLDEVGELELDLQAKLLRVLQERVVVPVGDHEGVPVDARVIAATNRELARAIAAGEFREDLYYRLHVVSLFTIPLRERPDDIQALAWHLLERIALRDGLPAPRLSPAALRRLQAYPWPGNVRQLENVLERAVVLGHEDELEESVILEMLSDQPESAAPRPPDAGRAYPKRECAVAALPNPPEQEGPWPTMADVEREHLLRTLRRTGYNQSATARLLGWDRNQLLRKVRKYGISLPGVKQAGSRTACHVAQPAP